MENKKKKFEECKGVDFDLMRTFAGLMAILIGFAYFLKALGLIVFNFNIFSLWPLIIIFFGLSLLSKRNIVSDVVGIVTMLLVLFVIFFSMFSVQINDITTKTTPIDVGIDQGVIKAKIGITTGAGNIDISGEENIRLVSGNLVSNIMDLTVSSKTEENIQSVLIVPFEKQSFLKDDPRNDFSLNINNTLPIDFVFQGGAANLNFDLRKVLAENINIDTGASKLDLKLGNIVSSNVKINAGASSINITLPKDVGVMLTIESGLSSKTLNGLVMENEKVYKTPDYDLKDKKINIDISMGMTSLNIDWEEMEVPRKEVQLYYYNQLEDKETSCGIDYVLPVKREVDLSQTPIQDTINLLIKGEITEQEKKEGFTTEFPNKDFKLIGANLDNGTLFLEFTEVPGFTVGGSCRVSILANQIIKTAKQFSGVNDVILLPDSIFQP